MQCSLFFAVISNNEDVIALVFVSKGTLQLIFDIGDVGAPMFYAGKDAGAPLVDAVEIAGLRLSMTWRISGLQ